MEARNETVRSKYCTEIVPKGEICKNPPLTFNREVLNLTTTYWAVDIRETPDTVYKFILVVLGVKQSVCV